MNDSGIELQRSGFFSGGERVFCGWGELSIWNGPGVFCIGKRDDKNWLLASLTKMKIIFISLRLLSACFLSEAETD